MFVQVIRGRTSDAGALRAQFDQWLKDLGPDAIGWVGSTGGVTAAGEVVLIARFESPEAANENGARPEQDAWWQETSKLLTDVRFADTTQVGLMDGGGSDAAQFVQVMEGELADPANSEQILREMEGASISSRPDVLGGLVALHGDRYTSAFYFTDEKSARAGEQREPTPEEAQDMERWNSIMRNVTYLDLTDPWLDSR